MSTHPVEVFYSYADADEALCLELDRHLSMLQTRGLIKPWHKRQVRAGTDCTKAIDSHLNTASIILFLVSSDFLCTKYCSGTEGQRALARHEEGDARVILILLRPVDWQSAPFDKLKVLPSNGKPVTSWSNRDEAFADVARGIRAELQYERQPRPNNSSPISDAEHVGTLLHTLHSHTGEVYSLVWSPDGSYLASAGADKTIFIVERTTQRVFQLPAEHTKTIFTLSWSPDGTRLASGGRDGFIHIWEVVSRRKLLTYHRHRDPHHLRALALGQSQVFSLAWSPDGSAIASAGKDKTVHVWNPATLHSSASSIQSTILRNHTGQVKAVAWSPDSLYLASAGDDAAVQVWNVSTREHIYTYRGHTTCVRALAWSPSGDVIASAGDDKTVHIWKSSWRTEFTNCSCTERRGFC